MVDVCISVDLTAITEDTVAVFVPEGPGVQHNITKVQSALGLGTSQLHQHKESQQSLNYMDQHLLHPP
jgi:hypothetical protein